MNLSFSEVLFLLRRGLINPEITAHWTVAHGDPEEALQRWKKARTFSYLTLLALAPLLVAIIYLVHKGDRDAAVLATVIAGLNLLQLSSSAHAWRVNYKRSTKFVHLINEANVTLANHPLLRMNRIGSACLHHPIDVLRLAAKETVEGLVSQMFKSQKAWGDFHPMTATDGQRFVEAHTVLYALGLCGELGLYLPSGKNIAGNNPVQHVVSCTTAPS